MSKFERAVAAVRGRVMGELSMTAPAVLVAHYRHWADLDGDKARLMAENLLLRIRIDAFTNRKTHGPHSGKSHLSIYRRNRSFKGRPEQT